MLRTCRRKRCDDFTMEKLFAEQDIAVLGLRVDLVRLGSSRE